MLLLLRVAIEGNLLVVRACIHQPVRAEGYLSWAFLPRSALAANICHCRLRAKVCLLIDH